MEAMRVALDVSPREAEFLLRQVSRERRARMSGVCPDKSYAAMIDSLGERLSEIVITFDAQQRTELGECRRVSPMSQCRREGTPR